MNELQKIIYRFKNMFVCIIPLTIIETIIIFYLQSLITEYKYFIGSQAGLMIIGILNFFLVFLLFDENHDSIRYELSKKDDGWGRCSFIKIGKLWLSFYPIERLGWEKGNFQDKVLYFSFNVGEIRWYLQ